MLLSEQSQAVLRQNVIECAAMLDETRPEWRDQIDWSNFEFIMRHKCVAGQLDLYLGSHPGFNVPEDIANELPGINSYTKNQEPYNFMHQLWLEQKPQN